MKLVINTCFGGFDINQEVIDEYGLDETYLDDHRDDTKLIKLIESGIDCNDDCSQLDIVEIPDNATDYKIIDCDGAEEVIYVVDGKLKWAYQTYE